jgi:hypothetical protein
MAHKGRKPKSPDQLRVKISLTIHPEILEWAEILKRRRSISQLFEDLVEVEWQRQQTGTQNPPPPAPEPPYPASQYFYPPSLYQYAQPQPTQTPQ